MYFTNQLNNICLKSLLKEGRVVFGANVFVLNSSTAKVITAKANINGVFFIFPVAPPKIN